MINKFDISHGSSWGWRRMEAVLLLRETNNVFSLSSPPLRVPFSFLRRKRSDRPVAYGHYWGVDKRRSLAVCRTTMEPGSL